MRNTHSWQCLWVCVRVFVCVCERVSEALIRWHQVNERTHLEHWQISPKGPGQGGGGREGEEEAGRGQIWLLPHRVWVFEITHSGPSPSRCFVSVLLMLYPLWFSSLGTFRFSLQSLRLGPSGGSDWKHVCVQWPCDAKSQHKHHASLCLEQKENDVGLCGFRRLTNTHYHPNKPVPKQASRLVRAWTAALGQSLGDTLRLFLSPKIFMLQTFFPFLAQLLKTLETQDNNRISAKCLF